MESDELTMSPMFRKFDFITGNLFTIILSFNTIFGTIINFWFILTILDNKILRSSKYIGIISLSIVDLCICLILSPLQIFRELISINENVSLSPFLCSLITFLSSWACLSSIFSLTLISIERLLVFKKNRHLNRQKLIVVMVITYLISFIFAALNSLMNWLGSSIIFIRCSNNFKNSIKFNYFTFFHIGFKILFIVVGFICLMATTYCYFIIYKIIRNKQLLRLKLNGLITLSKENHEDYGKNLIGNRRFSKSSNSLEKLSKMNLNKKNSLSMCHLNGKSVAESSDFLLVKAKTLKVSLLNLDHIEKDVTIVSINERLKENNAEKYTKNLKIKKSGTGSMESKAIRKTIIPIVVFYLFWLPYAVVQLCTLMSDSIYFELANLISISIGFSHSSINPIVYCCTNFEIRKAMKSKLRKMFSHQVFLIEFIDKIF
ncbi:unnamed protein product [Brachionus calyciflorus]|uniref:G-protein coupled receptors family 1 profile domain-containing protein n=1 Tax=Brachionus calyciflorus TaxID=104777 RepID=A0A813MLY5_9BILA|nr:unnamed protein product [Brachionus calyciflorus]